MGYTLISMLGKGMYKKEKETNGYQKTTYVLPDGKKYTSIYFLDTLINCKYRKFDKIIIVGTKTSTWNIILNPKGEELSGENKILWDEIEKAINTDEGISEEQKNKLEKYAFDKLKIPVKLITHTPIIDNSTASEIFECYNSIIPLIDSESNILFDITHGFRSMPILLYQALQYSLVNETGSRKVELVYGEYTGKDESTVRCLNEYWKYAEISNATSLFDSKLDGFYLAKLLKNEEDEDGWYNDCSKIIKKISEIVQTNFSLKIVTEENINKNPDSQNQKNYHYIIEELRDILQKYEEKERPRWTLKIKNILENIVSLVDERSKALTLYNYSQYLYKHNLNTQAVIALQVAVETAITEDAEHTESKHLVGNYNWWVKNGKKYLKKLKKADDDTMENNLDKLEHLRNQIAHGGSHLTASPDIPSCSEANIKKKYKDGKQGVEALFRLLGIMF